nr:phage protein [uncultured Mediterranean phage uvMED]
MARVGEIDFGDLEGDLEQVVKEATITLHSKLKLYEAASRGGIGTPVETGVLIGNWQMNMDSPGQGRVFNNLEYAEPVITGENLPPSWGGKHRTKQGTKVNYHESILEEVMEQDLPKIISSVSRRRR